MRLPAAVFAALLVALPAHARTLSVGAGKDFPSLKEAVAKSSAGDTIRISEGTYVNDFAVIRHPLTIEGAGKGARLFNTTLIPNGKGILVTKADVTLRNLTFEGAKVKDHNGAGIRYDGGRLVVENCTFRDNQNGILGTKSENGEVIIQDSRFIGNGYGDGYTHGIYLGMMKRLTVRRSAFMATRVGHHIKSRALETIVTGSYLDDADTPSSYAIDLPNGGLATLKDNILIQSSVAPNKVIINYGTRPVHPDSRLIVKDNAFFNLATSGTAIRIKTAGSAEISANSFSGLMKILKGSAKLSENRTLTLSPKAVPSYEEWLRDLPQHPKT